MLLDNIADILKQFVRTRRVTRVAVRAEQPVAALKSIGFDDFLAIDMPPREMLLDPILPERSLAMLYAPRGVGKTLLSFSIGLAVASGCPLLRWHAPRQRRVLIRRWRNAACFVAGTTSGDFNWARCRHSE